MAATLQTVSEPSVHLPLALQEGARYSVAFVVLVALGIAQIRLHLLARFWRWFCELDPRIRGAVGFGLAIALVYGFPRILLWIVRGV